MTRRDFIGNALAALGFSALPGKGSLAVEEAQCRVRRFRDLVARQTRLEGEPYVFHRRDVYEGELLAAAERAGADTFLSEDLADGETYCGIKAVNPFKEFDKHKQNQNKEKSDETVENKQNRGA